MTTDNQPIVLIPGFAGGNASIAPLRNELRDRRFDATYWMNSPLLYRRPLATYGAQLAKDALRQREATDQPLTLLGWSQGGLVAVSAMRHLTEAYGNPHEIVRKVITYGTPFNGTWAAQPAILFDHILRLHARELRRGHATLKALVGFLHHPRGWHFHAIHGNRDTLVSTKQPGLKPEWCHTGPFDHLAPIYDPTLFELIHRLILAP